MPKPTTVKPMPVQQLPSMATNAPVQAKPAPAPKTKKNAMAALFGQKRQKPAVASVPTKTPAF